MISATTVCMEQRPTDGRARGQQPGEGTGPHTLPFDFWDSRCSHSELSTPQVIARDAGTGTYMEHGRPVEEMESLHSSRNSYHEYILTPLNLGNDKAPLPDIESGSSYDSPDESFDYVPRTREGLSLVHHNSTESDLSMRAVSLQPPTNRRYPSAFDNLAMSPSSSTSGSIPHSPPPPPPPPPPPESGPSSTQRSSTQVLKVVQAPRKAPSRSPLLRPLKIDQISSIGRLPSVGSAPHLQARSRSRQPQPKESDDDIWERTVRSRTEVWGLRSRLSEQRNALKELGFARSVAYDKLMKSIRVHGFPSLSLQGKLSEEDNSVKLFEECERLSNEYGPLEEECNTLEARLNNREYEMQKLEAILHQRWKDTPRIKEEVTELSQTSDSPSNYSGSEMSQFFHPTIAEYLSKIGDVEILRERLDWHVEEKLALEEEKETKERVDRKIAEPDQEWLDNYAEAEAALIKQLQEAEYEAERLRALCDSLGLLDENGEPLDLERQERQNFIADEVDAGGEKSDFVKYPLLLPMPGTKGVQLADVLPTPEVVDIEKDTAEANDERIDPNDRINEWLLGDLRTSALHVNLLVGIFEKLVGHIPKGEKWQIDVLKVWYIDGSKEMADQPSRTLSDTATDSTQKTVEKPVSSSGRHSFGLMLISSKPRPPKLEDEVTIKGKEDMPLLGPPSVVNGKETKDVSSD
ncbi:hypothetical protein L207DRAFT_347061 [Hyaloscypha variabilis F]|uniref:Uncharacterized protein n=1 Tax=Hyaloscypha variabilis (strain UAMH 11265 / GT02V1 / F) TaxID=1149755 RepID=A0A2J6RQU6_HYAVF|nr:hypothetical protein L207DRAFT_347061 [Hyaloscypha variabilis F]